MPYFKKYKLRQISIPIVENWLNELSKKIGKSGKPLSSSTILRSYACMRIMMRRAKRLKYITELPLDEELTPKETIEERGVFTQEEWEELFRHERINVIWEGNCGWLQIVEACHPLPALQRWRQVLIYS